MKTIILTILLLSTQLFASVATITALKGKAAIQRVGSRIPASLGASLEKKDNILTQDNTKLQIIFKDETIVSIGKNSNFSISEYLFEDKQEPIAKFSMLRGAMRTITGQIGDIAPQKFSVVTKTATIGIRGTNFSLVVGDDDSYQAYCTYGAISVTIDGIEYIVQQGYFITINPDGKVIISAFTPKDLKEMRDTHFGITTEKNTRVTKSAVVNDTPDENNEQLNVTINDDTEIIIAELGNNVQDVIQNATGDVTTYVMNNALYTGTFSAGAGNLGNSGGATLTVNFGQDTAQLRLTNGAAVVQYDSSPNFNGNILTLGITLNTGLATATATGTSTSTFLGATGNAVDGTFNYQLTSNPNTGDTDNGTYSVTSSQVLY